MEDGIDILRDAKYMSLLYCSYGYWKIPVRTAYRAKNNFSCP